MPVEIVSSASGVEWSQQELWFSEISFASFDLKQLVQTSDRTYGSLETKVWFLFSDEHVWENDKVSQQE